ncbi:unnamed protein product [Closterium sp. NIES-53]
MDWIAALNDRGIREMSIVGDSHQRFLAAHLHFLLTGQADLSVRRGQDDLVFHAFDGSGGTLRINFYWIDGIYQNGEFGCTPKSLPPCHPPPIHPCPPSPPHTSLQGITTNQSKTFPNISTTADVTLFEGGYWAASFCRQPLKALRVHLAEFARWALAAAPVKGRVIFRTIPSFPVAGDRCNAWYPGPSSNRVAMAINVLLKHILLPRDSEDGEENGEGAGAENNGAAKGNGANSDFLGDNGATADGNQAAGENTRGEKRGGGEWGAAVVEEADEIAAASGADSGGGNGGVNGGGTATTVRSSPSPSRSAEIEALPAGAATVLDTWQVDASRYAETAAPTEQQCSRAAREPSRPEPSRPGAEPPCARAALPPSRPGAEPPCARAAQPHGTRAARSLSRLSAELHDLPCLCDRADGLSLFDLTSGASPAPAADADPTVRSQWATRDAAARLAVRRHLPTSERAHFSQYKSAQALYDAVVARYSSPATTALSRLMLPYLFPDLSAFPTVADLITHLRTSDTRRVSIPPPLRVVLHVVVAPTG